MEEENKISACSKIDYFGKEKGGKIRLNLDTIKTNSEHLKVQTNLDNLR